MVVVAVVGYAVALGLRVGVLWWTAGQLPDRVASHFGPRGEPDGWLSRRAFVVVEAILSLVLLVGVPLLLVASAHGTGAGLNIPHADYWLRPENRAGLRDRLLVDGLLLATACALLFSWIDVAVVRANRLAEPRMPRSVWVAVGLFVLAVAVGIALLSRQYAVG